MSNQTPTSTSIAALKTGQPIAPAKVKRSMTDIMSMPKEKQFPAMLDALQGEIKRALPAHLKPDRMARIALTCFRTVPKLAQCDPASVFAAVLQASQLGLEPGLLGHCYLIPFREQCQLIIGYQGLVDLVRRSGRVKSLSAHLVYTSDVFDLEFGLVEKLVHKPKLDGDRCELRLAYAVAHLTDGATHVEIMTRQEIERIRDRSQNVQNAKKYGKVTPWDTDFAEMARKTILRRICKYLPKSVELATAIALDNASYAAQDQALTIDDAIDGTYTPVTTFDPDTGEVIGENKGDSHQPNNGEPEKVNDSAEPANDEVDTTPDAATQAQAKPEAQLKKEQMTPIKDADKKARRAVE